jgi:hypothetical protein
LRSSSRSCSARSSSPTASASLAELAATLNEFERHYNEIAEPFAWNFTRAVLGELLERLATRDLRLSLAA